MTKLLFAVFSLLAFASPAFADLHIRDGALVDEEAIFSQSTRLGVGYLGWAWSGNSGAAANLDVVHDFDGARLTPWGERLINGPGGIRQTARPARVFFRGGRGLPGL